MTLENPFHWNDPVIIELIRLDYANAEELARVLAPLLSKDGRIVSYGPANSLIIKDRASIVKRIMEIVKGRSEQ
ncbi:MAG: secretin N-terminal domain-containing protein [Candidatus Bathyarchaeia archaeon]